MAFRASYEGLLNPRTPTVSIVEARFFTPEEAAQRLADHRPLKEPLLDYLQGERGRFYAYPGWGPPGVRV